MLRLRRELSTILIAVALVVLLPLGLRGQSPETLQASYDDNGQLIKVVDPSGNVTTYTYDAIGNVVSITTSTVGGGNVLAIFNFTPEQGGIGTTVTIQGQHFSAIPSSDIVKFNGTTAVVTAATSNSLTGTVPSGATTGPISVTVGSSTATTTTNFTVVPNPAITAVSPSSALGGSTVSTFQVTGLNLTGATFSFVPAFVPAAINVSNVVIGSGGTSATMTLTIAANAVGAFSLVATTTAGSSSQIPGANNTITVLSINPSADADGDGLTNLYENAISSNPLQASTTNDGIPDGWALFFGLSPTDPTGGGKIAPDGLTYQQAYQQGLNPLVPTLVPPTVANVFPINGYTNYPTNGVVVVRFSEPLQTPATLAAAQAAITAGLPPNSGFSGTDSTFAAQVLESYLLRTCCGGTAAVPGTVQLFQGSLAIPGTVILSNDALSLVFAPTSNLSSSTTYTVVAQGVKAASGIQMTQVFQSAFTTGLTTSSTTGSAVLTSPPNGATNVPTNAAFMVQFSKQVDPATVTPQTFYITDSVTGQTIPGTLQVDPSGFTASFVPQTTYHVGRQHNVTLTSGILDLTQNAFPGASFYFTAGFATQTQGPQLVGVSPANGATAVPLNSLLVAQFNEPLSVISATTGLQLQQGSTAIQGAIALSRGNTQVTFTPVAPLTAGTVYTIAVTAQITDVAENPLTNPGTFTFTTGTAADTTTPTVATYSPLNGETGVPTNASVKLHFSKQIDPLTATTSDFYLYPPDSGIPVPAAITFTPDGLTATLAPSSPLQSSTTYTIVATGGISDLEGHALSYFSTSFTTGNATDTTAPTVTQVSPPNASAGAPLNTQVVAVISAPVSAVSIGSSAITVSTGGTPVSGTITLSADQTTLTFTPGGALAPTTAYTVQVSGFTDQAGNPVTPFTSTFTTGTVAFGGGSFTVSGTNPVSGATGVSVSSPVTFTMSNLINPASVNPNTVFVYDPAIGGSQVVAGTYSVSGNTVIFTPLTPYPGNTLMNMGVYGLADEAGNLDYQLGYSFTTANTVDHTAPTVTITPSNGATNVGLNTQVVLTFSKSINPSTISSNSVNMWNGDVPLNPSISVSRDNRTVVLNPGVGQLPSGATLTVTLTGAIQDFSGNALTPTSSQFTLTTAPSGTAPTVIAMRPGNGATNVPANTVVTLFASMAMNASSIAGALHVSDNGVLVSGAVQLFSSGQVIEFTPTVAFTPGDLIQVFLDSTAQSANGVALSSFSGQFTVAGSPANTTAQVQTVNPSPNATKVPLNTIVQIEYNEALAAATVNNINVTLYQYSTSTYLTPTLSLAGGGQAVQIQPTSNLAPNSQYQACVAGVTNIDGVPVQTYCFTFYAGTAVDTAAPTIKSVAPPNAATNIGTNAGVSVTFNKAINPVSVTGATIQLSGGSVTETPSSISFSPDYTRVTITPQAPLLPSTVMTIAINGVTSEAGVAVASQSTTFTTMAGPDFVAPYVVNASVQSGQASVPVNSVFSMQFSKPMDTGSFNASNVYVSGGISNSIVPSTVTWSADQTTIFIVPTSPLNVGGSYSMCSYYMTDLSGNPQTNFCVSFTTAFTTNTNPPTVVNTSPENNETLVPTNSPIEVLFSEPVQPTSVGQITLKTGSTTVAVTPSFVDANQLLVLTPSLPLSASATYTLTITGVKDTAGNQMTTPVVNTFTVGPTFDLVHPAVVLSDPAPSTTGVGTNLAPRITFSKRLNPLSVVTSSNEVFNRGSVELYNSVTGQYVPATVNMSADRMTATLAPTAALSPNTLYYLYVAYGASYYDVAGNPGGFYSSAFTTGSSTDTTHTTVSTISPVNGQTGVPLNAQIVAVMGDDIDPTTVSNSSITVTPSGGSAIAGTVTLASDGVTLTFVPGAALAASKVYNISVGGFSDTEGNTVTTFTSSFTTGTVAYGTGSFVVSSTNPVSGATGVSVSSPVTFTMSNLINPASVNPNTVFVYDPAIGGSQVVAGTYSVSGNTVIFTPLTPYPGNTLMNMGVYGLADEAGNLDYQLGYSFTTANTVDHTAPTVTITPSNGATNVGLNTQVVLTFSKSINPTTINGTTMNLLNGDVPLNPSVSISRDNRTVVLSVGQLPAGATLTVTASHLITDLSGNALADTTSQFTTTPAVLSSAPSVVSMRPGNGATNVPTSTVITLFTSAPMNAGTISGALHVAQNGVPVAGTTTVGSNGQSVVFTPTSALAAGTVTPVFLSSTAQDIYGNNLSAFAGSFTTAGSLVNTAAVVQAVNPFPSASNVPLNTIVQIEFNQALVPVTVNNVNVTFYQYSTSTYLTPTLSLVGGGQVIQIQPTSNLVASSQYQACVGGVTNIDGVPVQSYCYNFTAGTAVDTTAATIVSVAPPNAAINIGTNAGVSVTFSKAINPVSVTGSTVQLSGGSVTETPTSISFSPDYTRATLIPQAPLPSSTLMTIAISGVTSQAGVPVASQSTTFTTMAGPDFSAPFVSNPSVQSSQTVGTNAVLSMQFNKPMYPGSVNPLNAQGNNPQYVYIYDFAANAYVATTISLSADLTTVFLKPTAALGANHNFNMCSYYMTDIVGNPQSNFCVYFLTGTGTVTTGPSVVQVSPSSGQTGVPLNSPAQILFSEAVDAASLGGVTLKQGSTVIPTTTSLYDGDKGVQLLPLTPLSANTTYTINVTGVLDITGNAQTSFPSQSFTTGTGINLVVPALVSINPTNAATNVPVTTTVQVVFSEPMDVASFDPNNSFQLADAATSSIVPATITFSANNTTATLTPMSNLTGGGVTYYMYIGWSGWNVSLYDLAGNRFGGTYITFTTK